MSDKKYYWIKLKTDFFDQDTIDFLMGQENGSKYVVIYQMLMLKTAQQGGVLATKANELLIPYDVKKIVRDTKYFDFDTVTIALELFKKLGLVYEEENHILRLTGAEKIVGSEWSSAERVRKYREGKKALQCNTNVTKSNAQCNTDIDIDIDIDIDKDIKNKIIYLLSSSKNTYIGLKLENEFNETLEMMIKAAQVTKVIPEQGRLEDLMKEIIFERDDVRNKQAYIVECFKHEG